MGGRICCVILAIGVASTAAFAQSGMRSASLPERGLTVRSRSTIAVQQGGPGRASLPQRSQTMRPRGQPPRNLIDGLRSASLPETTLTPRPPSTTEGRDVFRARRGTYRPNPNLLPYPFYGYEEPLYPDTPQVIVVQIPRESIAPPSVAPPPTPYVPGTPGAQKTFYVIPRCYAGDRRPQAESLAPGCDLSQLRVIPPS